MNNLVGSPRFISGASGLRFGGGGGSSLEFQFSVDKPVTLDSYGLASFGILGNAEFNILDETTVISGPNQADTAGSNDFIDMPALEAGTLYTFKVNTSGAAIQASFETWGFSVVPEPSSAVLGALSFPILFRFRRRK